MYKGPPQYIPPRGHHKPKSAPALIVGRESSPFYNHIKLLIISWCALIVRYNYVVKSRALIAIYYCLWAQIVKYYCFYIVVYTLIIIVTCALIATDCILYYCRFALISASIYYSYYYFSTGTGPAGQTAFHNPVSLKIIIVIYCYCHYYC